jgi:GTP cyclohydrolase I
MARLGSEYITNPALGEEVRKHLVKMGFETPLRDDPDFKLAESCMEEGLCVALNHLGLDLTNPSLMRTPARYAKMFIEEFCAGLDYERFPECTIVPNGTYGTIHSYQTEVEVKWDKEKRPYTDPQPVSAPEVLGAYDQMVLVQDIQIMSLCEHHLMPIDGVAHIAYIPNRKLLGLSKFARVAEFFARRPQVQERLTAQIYEALAYILGTQDIAVCIKATHMCMKARGAQQQNSKTVTDRCGGRFLTNPPLRKEFFDAVRA